MHSLHLRHLRPCLTSTVAGLTWHEQIFYHNQRLAWLGMKTFPTTVRGWPDLAWREFLPQSEVGLKRFPTTVRSWPDLAWRDFLPQSGWKFSWKSSGWSRLLAWKSYIASVNEKKANTVTANSITSEHEVGDWTVHIRTSRQHSSMHHGYIHVSKTHSSGHIHWWPECQGYWGSTACDWKLNGMYIFTPMHCHVMVWRAWCIFSWTAFTFTPQKDVNVLGIGLQYSSQFPLSMFVWI